MTSGNDQSTSHRRATPSSALARLFFGLAASLAALVLAWQQGRGPLGTPPTAGLRFDTIERWYRQRTPIEMSLGIIRVITLIAAVGAVVVFGLALLSAILARTTRSPLQRLSLSFAALLPRRLRRLRDLAAGVGLSAALGLGPLIGAHAATPPRSATAGEARTTIAADKRSPIAPIDVRSAGDPTSGQEWPDVRRRSPTTSRTPATPAATTNTKTKTAPATTPTAPEATTPTTPATPAATTPTTPTIPTIPGTTPPKPASVSPALQPSPPTAGNVVAYLVRPGDSFWSIAEEIVLRANPHAPESAIAHYWKALIAENRALLPDPSNPDVLLVGTTIRLPKTG